MLRTVRFSVLLTVALCSLSACSGIPVPPERQDYIGTWEGPGVTLTITADGGVHYVKVSGTGNTEVKAPLQAFRGNSFKVGAMGFTTTFKVERPPYPDHEIGEVWKMQVDGVELTRK